jgi:hypothetical protein
MPEPSVIGRLVGQEEHGLMRMVMALTGALVLGLLMSACSGPASPEADAPTAISGPALIVFYTDN